MIPSTYEWLVEVHYYTILYTILLQQANLHCDKREERAVNNLIPTGGCFVLVLSRSGRTSDWHTQNPSTMLVLIRHFLQIVIIAKRDFRGNEIWDKLPEASCFEETVHNTRKQCETVPPQRFFNCESRNFKQLKRPRNTSNLQASY